MQLKIVQYTFQFHMLQYNGEMITPGIFSPAEITETKS